MEDKKNAVFLKRFIAYIIDFVLISLCAGLLSIPFVDTSNEEKLNHQMSEITEKYVNKEISINTYIKEYSSLYYDVSRNQGITIFITVVLEILYFVVYQLYNDGQTLGKKTMKIKVVSNDGELTMNTLIARSFLIDSIFLHLVTLVCITFLTIPMNYFYIVGSFEMIQALFVFITVIMVMYSKDKRGVHDRITNTTVINC